MNITPTTEFQLAFERVTGLEPTLKNLITTIRENWGLFQQVRKVHADIVRLAEKNKPTASSSLPNTESASCRR